jgi:hypothetical protein
MNSNTTMTQRRAIDIPSTSAVRDKRARPVDASASDIFAQALLDDSNHELDWLWAATQLTDIIQRRYCLERALAINNNSELARRELQALAAGPERLKIAS